MARRPRDASIRRAIGGVLVRFDEQVWRQRPPAQERVEQVDRVLTVVATGGMTVHLPRSLDQPRSASSETPDHADGVSGDAPADQIPVIPDGGPS